MTEKEAKQLYLSEKNDALNNGSKNFMGFYEWLNRKGIYEFNQENGAKR